jgi:starch synthase
MTILAHHIYAGADMFVMPSRVEPCAYQPNDCHALWDGAVVHATGGLRDTVRDYQPRTNDGTGFVFGEPTARVLVQALERALQLYRPAPMRFN